MYRYISVMLSEVLYGWLKYTRNIYLAVSTKQDNLRHVDRDSIIILKN